MIIRIDNTDIYILEQQHRAGNCKSTTYVKSIAVPDVAFAYDCIRTIYIRGSN